MDSSIAITVIIPTYRPKDYIEKCLISLSKQTLSSSLFEIIVVLNGCKEPWETFIFSLIDKHLSYNNAILIQTDIPGVSNARNIALNAAKGEYIAFIDDDDYISPEYLEELLNVSSKNCIGLTDSIYFNDRDGKSIIKNSHHIDYLKLKDLPTNSLYKSRRFFNGPVMKLIHRDVIGNRRFDTRFTNGEDSLFMALISDRIIKCSFCEPNAVYYRRIRINSATTLKRSWYQNLINNFKCIIQYLKYWSGQPTHYNVPFMTSRILASIKNILIK